jgi:hypothetical protein
VRLPMISAKHLIWHRAHSALHPEGMTEERDSLHNAALKNLNPSACRRTSTLLPPEQAFATDKLLSHHQTLDPESSNQNHVYLQPLRNGLFHLGDAREQSPGFPAEDFCPSGNRMEDLRTHDGRRPAETRQPFPSIASLVRCSLRSLREIRSAALDQRLLRSTKAPSPRNRPRIPPRRDSTKLAQVDYFANAHRTGQSEEQVVFSQRKNTTLRMSGFFSAAGNIQPKLMRQRKLTQERSVATSIGALSVGQSLFAGFEKLPLLRRSFFSVLRTQHRIPQQNVDRKEHAENALASNRCVTAERPTVFCPSVNC